MFIDETAALGGAEINLLRITAELARRDLFDSVVFLPEEGPLAEKLVAQNVQVKIVPGCPHYSTSFFVRSWMKLPNPFAIIANFALGLRWASLLGREIQADSETVVYTNSLMAHIFGGMAGRLRKCKVCWHFQDIVDQNRNWGLYRKILLGLAIHIPDVIICISQQVASQFGGDQSIEKKIRIMLNQIDYSKFKPEAGHWPGEMCRNGLRIGTVARLTPWKGQAEAIKVAEILSRANLSFLWSFAGDTSLGEEKYRENLVQGVHLLHLEDKVRFLGWVDDIEAFYQSIDLLVHIPNETEPFGLTIIEAMSNGVPVIATPGGAADQYVQEGGGWIVNSEDFNGIASIIKHLIECPDELLLRSKKTQQVIKENMSFENYITNLASIVSSI